MNERRRTGHIVDILFVLSLFMLFAVSSVMLIAIGASVYRSNLDRMELNYTVRTARAFLTEKIRTADAAGSVEIGEFDGGDALLLHQYINGISYTTRLYVHEGSLTELYSRSDLALAPAAGDRVLPLRAMELSPIEDHAISITLTETDGTRFALVIALRGAPYRITEETGDGG